MVALTPEQQQHYLREHGAAFEPVKGAWGLQGATLVRLSAVDEETLGEALTLARQNVAARVAAGRSRQRLGPAAATRGRRGGARR
jgi:hypothetical protein